MGYAEKTLEERLKEYAMEKDAVKLFEKLSNDEEFMEEYTKRLWFRLTFGGGYSRCVKVDEEDK